MNVGYVRVSTVEQNTDRQLERLTKRIRLDKLFEDQASAGSTDRPGLDAALTFLRDGDVLHVHSIDRLARNLQDLQGIIGDLNGRGVAITFHTEGLTFYAGDGADPMAKLMLQMMGAFAEFERALIRERQAEGIARAKAKGVYKGRKRQLTDDQVNEIRTRKDAGERVAALAREYGVSRTTVYTRLQELDQPPTLDDMTKRHQEWEASRQDEDRTLGFNSLPGVTAVVSQILFDRACGKYGKLGLYPLLEKAAQEAHERGQELDSALTEYLIELVK
jgi:DNA invertase Pin-like site-specific DNA recombinase